MKTTLLTLLLLQVFSSLSAQNLINNYSFETYSSCPNGSSQITFATDWNFSRNLGEYLNSCSSSIYADVPTNYFGFQEASSGQGYVGGLMYGSFASAYIADLREFFYVPLNTPLTVGTTYYVSFKVNLADNSEYAVNNIGAQFVSAYNNNFPINNTAHVYTTSVVSDKTNWTTISGSFVPTMAYNAVMFGNFFTDANTTATFVGSSTDIGYNAYYFFDDVYVGTTPVPPCYFAPVTDASFAYANDGYCQAGTDPTPTIYGAPGGTFSAPPEVSIAPSTGTIDVSASTAGGPYTITYNTGGACPSSSTFSLSIENCMPGATLTDALVIDNGAAGKAEPGDRIRLTAKISNTQAAADYAGVQLALNNDPRVTFVSNSFKSTPVAVDDAYLATKNVQLVVAAGSGVLTNDFDNAALNVNATSSSSAQGGLVVINANGSFTYTPPNNFTGNDTFTYTITDSDMQNDVATVSIRVQ